MRKPSKAEMKDYIQKEFFKTAKAFIEALDRHSAAMTLLAGQLQLAESKREEGRDP